MDTSFRRAALLGLVAGSSAAFGIMGALALRTAWAVTKGGRWHQVKQFLTSKN